MKKTQRFLLPQLKMVCQKSFKLKIFTGPLDSQHQRPVPELSKPFKEVQPDGFGSIVSHSTRTLVDQSRIFPITDGTCAIMVTFEADSFISNMAVH